MQKYASWYSSSSSAFFLCILLVLLNACSAPWSGTSSNQQVNAHRGNSTVPAISPTATSQPTTVPMPPTDTSCPSDPNDIQHQQARAAVMQPMTSGTHPTLIFSDSKGIKSYDTITKQIKLIISQVIGQAQVSQDGQWLLFTTRDASKVQLQLIRLDGQGLQTLYCDGWTYGLSSVSWSPDSSHIILTNQPEISTDFDLLTLATGQFQPILSWTQSTPSFNIRGWLDNQRILLDAGPSNNISQQGLYILDTSKGPQTWLNLQRITQGASYCSDATMNAQATILITSKCASNQDSTDPQINNVLGQQGPSSIFQQDLPGTHQSTLFTDPQMAIGQVRFAGTSSTALLLNINNYGPGADSSQNGIWKMNLDGSGLTRLFSTPANQSFRFFQSAPWSIVSRDNQDYAIALNYQLYVGSLAGGTPTLIESAPDMMNQNISIAGWTTL